MHEYDQLEREVRKYYIRKILLFTTIILLLGGLGIFLYLFVGEKVSLKKDSNTSSQIFQNSKKMQETNRTKNHREENKSNVLIKKITPIIPKSTPKKIVYPDLSFQNDLEILLQQAILQNKMQTFEEKSTSPKKKIVIPKPKPTVKIATQTLTKTQIKNLESQFFQNPRFGIAWTLAQYYYKHHQFKKSAFWSLKANSLQKENEDTWILFAQSIVKLGRKKEAQKVLQHYLSQNPDAKKVRKYLSKIQGYEK